MISESATLFCKDDISLIENYEEAINDENETWICHHKLGIELGKTSKELIKLNLYYNRPANEFIFLRRNEHRKLHANNMTEEHKRKNSESLKKRFGTEYYHNLFSYNSSGENNPMYGHVWTDEQRENARQAALNRDNTNVGKYERTPEINAKMSKSLKGKMEGKNNPMYGRRGEKSPSYGTHWYNNGEISVKCKECPEGFVRGRLYKFKKQQNY